MNEFRETLLALEPLSDQRRERLELEVKAMAEHKLSGLEWWYQLAGVVGAVVFVVIAALMQITPKVDRTDKMIWALGGVVSAASLFISIPALMKRSQNIRRLTSLSKAGPAAALGIVIVLLMNVIAQPTITNLAWLMAGVIWLMLATGIVLYNRIVTAELDGKEQSLRLEYRLAELMEKMDRT